MLNLDTHIGVFTLRGDLRAREKALLSVQELGRFGHRSLEDHQGYDRSEEIVSSTLSSVAGG